ncbi:hypothetical protein [Paraburkholderia dilworthii]|uniref:AP2 domain-containing protein n=1 Tax=Paraburkholderia dilworthii TaxID=948106 RepID=A0ABW9D558_9BURK
MARPAHKNPSAATVRRRENRARWRDARRFTGFSFEAAMYDRAKTTWQQDRERFGGTTAGRSTFTDFVAGALNVFVQRSADERADAVAAYMNAETARRADAASASAIAQDADASNAVPSAGEASDGPAFDFNSLSAMSNVDEVTL